MIPNAKNNSKKKQPAADIILRQTGIRRSSFGLEEIPLKPARTKKHKTKAPKSQPDYIRRQQLTVLKSGIILIIAALLGIKFGLIAGLLWGIFLTFLLFALDSRYIAGAALLCLSSCPVLLILDREDTAETMAVYAYYFLVMTVALQIVEEVREGRASNAH